MKQLEIIKKGHLIGHRNPIYALEIGAGVFYTAGNDRGVVEWSLEDLAFKRILCPVSQTVYRLHLLPGTNLLAIGMQDGTVILVDRTSGAIQQTLQHSQAAPVFGLGTLHTRPSDQKLVVACESGSVFQWGAIRSANDGQPAEQPIEQQSESKISDGQIRSMAVSPNGMHVAFGSKDGVVHLRRSEDMKAEHEWNVHEHTVTSLSFSPDGRYLLSGGRDARLYVFDLEKSKLHLDFVPHMYAVYAINYHPTLPIFATSSRDKSIKIWSAEDFRLLRTISIEKGFEAHTHSVNDLAWSTDGTMLFSVGDDRMVMAWSINAH